MIPSARKLIANPPTIWSARRWMAKNAWTRAKSAAGERRREQPEHPRAQLVGGQDPEEGAAEQHPLEADVHDAAPLGEDAADGGERERRGVAQHRGEERRPDDDLIEVLDAGAGGEVAEAHPGDAGEHGAVAEADHAPAEREGADADRDEPEHDRHDRLANRERRQRDPEGREADDDAAECEGARRPAAAGRAGARSRRHPPPEARASRAGRGSARRRRRRGRRGPG